MRKIEDKARKIKGHREEERVTYRGRERERHIEEEREREWKKWRVEEKEREDSNRIYKIKNGFF